jgi:isochorismate pyruvate lyase
MSRAIDKVKNCSNMQEVRAGVNALDDILVPLLVERSGYMTQAAKVKNNEDLVRDEARIQTIVDRVRPMAQAQGGNPDLMERLYRAMMECYIDYEHQELARPACTGLEAPGRAAMKLLMIDNYDSFTYNIVQYLGELGAQVIVVRNDESTLDEVIALVEREGVQRIVISPGRARRRRLVFRWPPSSTLRAGCQCWACVWAPEHWRCLWWRHHPCRPANARQNQRHQHRPEGRVCRSARAVHGQPLPLAGDRQDHAARLPASDGDQRRR